MGNRRFWVTVHLLDFKTAKSGHFFSNDGEWYNLLLDWHGTGHRFCRVA